MKSLPALLALILLLFHTAPAQTGKTESAAASGGASNLIYLGVLEDSPGDYAGEPHNRTVRVVFYKDSDDWKALPNNCPDPTCLESVAAQYPRQVNWTIAFDGKRVGEVTGLTPEQFEFYSHVGRQKITSSGPVPTIGNRSEQFGGFLGTPVVRPLIANSRPFFQDPDRWKPSQLPPATVSAVRQQFRKRFPKVENCAKLDDEAAQPWDYRDDNVTLVKAYSSASGWVIAEMLLTEYRCDGPADDPFVPQWFVIAPAGQIRHLGSSMWLVDAGDYDGDGKSELVFSIDDYNRGGYKIFYDNFQKQAVFEFSFH
jgi:hypothetical protein